MIAFALSPAKQACNKQLRVKSKAPREIQVDMVDELTKDAFTLLDSAEALAALRISKSTLHRLVRQGKLKRSSVSTGRALFPLSEIQRLICTPLEMQRSV